jgi:hypothetical protein
MFKSYNIKKAARDERESVFLISIRKDVWKTYEEQFIVGSMEEIYSISP